MWKRECFNEIANEYNLDLPSNIISIGDNFGELEAGRDLEKKFKKSFIKTIKFKKDPTIEDLIYQLSIVNEKFDYLCETCKNWNVFWNFRFHFLILMNLKNEFLNILNLNLLFHFFYKFLLLYKKFS